MPATFADVQRLRSKLAGIRTQIAILKMARETAETDRQTAIGPMQPAHEPFRAEVEKLEPSLYSKVFEGQELPRDADGSVDWIAADRIARENLYTSPIRVGAAIGEFAFEKVPRAVGGALRGLDIQPSEGDSIPPTTRLGEAVPSSTGVFPQKPIVRDARKDVIGAIPEGRGSTMTRGEKIPPPPSGPIVASSTDVARQPEIQLDSREISGTIQAREAGAWESFAERWKPEDRKAIVEAGTEAFNFLPPVLVAKVGMGVLGLTNPFPIKDALGGMNWSQLQEKYPDWAAQVEHTYKDGAMDLLVLLGAGKVGKSVVSKIRALEPTPAMPKQVVEPFKITDVKTPSTPRFPDRSETLRRGNWNEPMFSPETEPTFKEGFKVKEVKNATTPRWPDEKSESWKEVDFPPGTEPRWPEKPFRITNVKSTPEQGRQIAAGIADRGPQRQTIETLTPESPKAKTSEGVTIDVFHGTSRESAVRIAEEGLIPSKSVGMRSQSQASDPFVYVTPKESSAKWYATQNFRFKSGGEVVRGKLTGKVIEVDEPTSEYGAMAKVAKDLGYTSGRPSLVNLPDLAKRMKDNGISGILFKDKSSGNRSAIIALPDAVDFKIKKATPEPPIALKAPLRAQEQAPGPSGKVSLLKAEAEKLYEQATGEKLSPTKRRGWDADNEAAAAEGLAEKAPEIFRAAARSGRPVSSKEHVAAIQRVVSFKQDIAESRRLFTEAAKRGDDAVASQEMAQTMYLSEQLAQLAEDARLVRSESGRALNIGKLGIDPTTYEIGSVLQMARAKKGSALTPGEIARHETNVKNYETTQKRLAELESENAKLSADHDKIVAERVTRIERQRVADPAKKQALKDKLSSERAKIEADLAAMGNRINTVIGPPADAMYLMGKLAKTYIQEGAASLEEVVAKIKKKFPDVTDRDVWEALQARSPETQAKAKTVVERNLSEFKTQARLLAEIDNLEKGVAERPTTGTVTGEQSTTVRILKKRLTELRNSLYKSNMPSERLEASIQTLNELQDHLANHTRPAKRGAPEVPSEVAAIKEKIRVLRRQMKAEDVLTDLQEQLRTGEFKVTERRTPFVAPELERTQIEIKRARQRIEQEIEKQRPRSKWEKAGEVIEVVRTAQTTGDLSYNLRQNIVAALSHPITTGKAAGQALAGTFSKYKAEQLMNHLERSPNAVAYERMGIKIHQLESHTPGLREETFHGSLLEKIPWLGEVVKGANRNMTLTGNLTRTALADAFLERNPNATLPELKAYGHALNVFTGIGDLSSVGKAANVLNKLMFSPKLAVSRFQTPWELYRTRNLPRVRKQVARDLVGFVGTGSAILALAKLSLSGEKDASVGDDPRNSDWGKIRIGDTRIDIWGGFLQPARLIYRLGLVGTDRLGWSGQDLRPGEKDMDPLEMIGRFAAFKLAPTPNLGLEILRGKTAIGEPTTVTETMARTFQPLFYQDVRDAAKQSFGMAGVVLPLVMLGVGASTYPDSKTRVTKDVRQALDAGDKTKADSLKARFAVKHPGEKIGDISNTRSLVIGDIKRAHADGEHDKAQKIKDDWNKRHPDKRIY